MKKRAFELSINFLVMLILAIAMFGVGAMLLKDIFLSLFGFTHDMEEKVKEEIIHKLGNQGIALSSQHIQRGKYDYYYIGIRNDLDYTNTFYIHSECDFAMMPDNTNICDDDKYNGCDQFDSWIAYNPVGPFEIPQYDRDVKTIDVYVPKNAQKGTYQFDVRVCTDDPCTDQYLIPQRLSVVVD